MRNEQHAQTLLRRIQEAGFVLQELVLYLDTHPDDSKALAMYRNMQKTYHALVERYEATVSPLHAFGVSDSSVGWTWGKDSWPWQIRSESSEQKGGCLHVDV